jgi:hypothetical protein
VTAAALPVPSSPPPAYLRQWEAARYLGVSVRWFRDHVHVEALPIGKPAPGRKPVLRYRVADLDAWVAACAAYRQPRRLK